MRKKVSTNSSTIPKKKVVINAPLVANVLKSNIIIPDSNILIQDPEASLSEFLKGGNLVVIPWWVFMEVDKFKRSKDLALDARKAIKKIAALMLAKANIIIELNESYAKSQLDKNIDDHRVIAALRYVEQSTRRANSPYAGYNKIKFISNDVGARLMAQTIMKNAPNLIIDAYQRDQTKLKKNDLVLGSINVPGRDIKKGENGQSYFLFSKATKVLDNTGMIVYSDLDSAWHELGVAVSKNNRMLLLNKQISASGISARGNGHANWEQILALHFLLDPQVSCVFLQGSAGTGKTLLALAAALELCKKGQYNEIIVSRPITPLDKQEELGFLPGDMYQKISPWIKPIFQNIALIKNSRDYLSPDVAVESLHKLGVSIQPLAYIRGTTFSKTLFIVDEAQNLTAHQIKTIITRLGEGSKVIFTGDLSQIDNPNLNAESSGLAYAIRRMKGSPMVGIVNLSAVIRSPLVEYANKVL